MEKIGYEFEGGIRAYWCVPGLTVYKNGLREIKLGDNTMTENTKDCVLNGNHFQQIFLDHDDSTRSYISLVQVHSDDEDPPLVKFSGLRPKKEQVPVQEDHSDQVQEENADQVQEEQAEQDQLYDAESEEESQEEEYMPDPPQPDPSRAGSRAERVQNVEVAVPAPVNTAYWDHYQPDLLGRDDNSDYISSESEYDSGFDEDSGYTADSSWSTGWEEPEVIVLSDDEPEVQMAAPVVPEPEVQMVAPVAREGDKHRPIDVDALPDVPDIVKKEVEVVLTLEAHAEVADKKMNKKKRKMPEEGAAEVRRSKRLKKMA